VTTRHDSKFETLPTRDLQASGLIISVDLQQRNVELWREGLIMRDIAAQMKVSVGGIDKTLCTWICRRGGRPQLVDDDNAWYLKSVLGSNPTLYCDEFRNHVQFFRLDLDGHDLLLSMTEGFRQEDVVSESTGQGGSGASGGRDSPRSQPGLLSEAGNRLTCNLLSYLYFSMVSITRYFQH